MRTATVIHHRPHHRQHHIRRPALPMPSLRPVGSTRPLRLSLIGHLSLLPALPRQAIWRSSAKTLTTRSNAHLVASTALRDELARAGFDLSLIDANLRLDPEARAVRHQGALDLVNALAAQELQAIADRLADR